MTQREGPTYGSVIRIKSPTIRMAKNKQTLGQDLQLPMLLEPTGTHSAGLVASSPESEDEKAIPNSGAAVPFVKWVGGKRSIVSRLKLRLPQSFNRYYEPFVGGGALFFEIHRSISSAHLSDSNLDLILTYMVVKKDPEKLVARLRKHARSHDEDYYYKVRSQHGQHIAG